MSQNNCDIAGCFIMQRYPDFSNLQGKRKLVRELTGVQNIGGKITVKQIQGKRLLIWFELSDFFEKSRVREIGIPLSTTDLQCNVY